jgi:vancomycin permeability regulator SanA
MVARTARLIFKISSLLMAISLVGMLVTRLVTLLYARPRQFSLPDAPNGKVAIVFGAGLRRDGTPTAVLRDRVETAAQLYFDGKVDRLLMSGDNRFEYYNEPGAMRTYAIQLGVPEADIVQDFAGRSTYETCYRARDIFHVTEAILVTQGFHLPRALFTCNALGLQAVGVPADQRTYRRFSQFFWGVRETFATLNAFWEVYVSRPLPVLGQPEPIFPLEAQ